MAKAKSVSNPYSKKSPVGYARVPGQISRPRQIQPRNTTRI